MIACVDETWPSKVGQLPQREGPFSNVQGKEEGKTSLSTQDDTHSVRQTASNKDDWNSQDATLKRGLLPALINSKKTGSYGKGKKSQYRRKKKKQNKHAGKDRGYLEPGNVGRKNSV